MPDAVIPLVLFGSGPSGSAGTWAEYTDNSTTEDDITFLGVHAWGDIGRQAPTTFGPFTSANNKITGCGIVDGNKTYVFLFNRDPDNTIIDSTETITLTGMNLPTGTKIRAMGWSNTVPFTASANGTTLLISSGQGTAADELIFETEL